MAGTSLIRVTCVGCGTLELTAAGLALTRRTDGSAVYLYECDRCDLTHGRLATERVVALLEALGVAWLAGEHTVVEQGPLTEAEIEHFIEELWATGDLLTELDS